MNRLDRAERRPLSTLTMTTLQALRNYWQSVDARLAEKTGWGRNDLSKMLEDEYRCILEKIITETETK